MNLKNLVTTAINKNDFVKISNTLKISANESNNQVTVRLFKQGSLIWIDTNSLDNIIQDLENEISNFG